MRSGAVDKSPSGVSIDRVAILNEPPPANEYPAGWSQIGSDHDEGSEVNNSNSTSISIPAEPVCSTMNSTLLTWPGAIRTLSDCSTGSDR